MESLFSMVAYLGALKIEHHLVSFVNFLEQLFCGTSSSGYFCTVWSNFHVKILTHICNGRKLILDHMKELFCKNSEWLIAINYFRQKFLSQNLIGSYIPLWLRDIYNIKERKFQLQFYIVRTETMLSTCKQLAKGKTIGMKNLNNTLLMQ